MSILYPVLTALMLVVALAFFVAIMKVKIQVLLKARPEVRWDRIGERIETMLRVAFFQKKLFKDPAPGLMHALIFWGFLVLLVRSISLIGRGFVGPESNWTLFWFSKGLEGVYTFLKDWTELVVLAMVTWAWGRRWLLKPKRLTINFSGYLVLGLIGGLMITDFLYDGSRFAWAGLADASGTAMTATLKEALSHEKAMAPVSAFVGSWFASSSPGFLDGFQTVMLFLHLGILLFFLNELPRSKHFHVITSIPNTFFAKLDPPGALAPIRDIENQETFGVNEPRELTWKQIFDGYSCTECGRCTMTCPTVTTGKTLSPKMLIVDMRDYVKAHEAEILAGKDTAESGTTLIDAVKREAIWACTTCRSCEENCPLLITHTDKIVDYRRRLTLMDGDMAPEVATTMKNLENKSNPWGLPMGERGLWMVEELGVPLISEKGETDVLFYLGCSGAFDDRNKKVVTAVARLLQKAGVDFAILGPEEGCCGDSARRLGNEYLFQMQAQQNIEVFKQYKFKRILTTCPHGYNTIRNEYPQFGGEFPVVHHTELLAELIREGRLTIPAGGEALRVVFHDSCYLGRYNGIYDEPREVLRALPGISLGEIEKSRENGMCCGAGGGMMWKEEHEGDRINRTRVKQLQGANPEVIASACPFCLVMNKDGVAELDLTDSLRTKDVAEILAERVLS
ncbi:MAG TPA: (Fe-S)-binding protein [Myxococcota bacterium]|nr:(Fe-S)-binding protein [Myxococcota bacterium]HQK52117.1 (Fe-S)-binding protein [Myxococcota bacterium]